MRAFRTALITSIGAFIIGVYIAPEFVRGPKVVKPDSALKSSNAGRSSVGLHLVPVERSHGDSGTPAGYSPLGIAKINGRRIAVYAFRNGAKLDDVAGEGHGFADVFDRAGHLMRRFTFRESLNSPPLITEFVYMPAR
jgi:hypothetical protein